MPVFNLGTAVVLIAVIAVVALVIVSVIRDKKAGRKSCGCGCAHCAMHGQCHSDNKKPSSSV